MSRVAPVDTKKYDLRLTSHMSEDAIDKAVEVISQVHEHFDQYRTPGGSVSPPTRPEKQQQQQEVEDDEDKKQVTRPTHLREMTVDDIERLIELAAANKRDAQVDAIEKYAQTQKSDESEGSDSISKSL